MSDPICSCGIREHHELARRHSADGRIVCLWSTGAVTGPMGYAAHGITFARPRSALGRQRALAAGWMFLEDVALYDAGELALFYRACAWAVARGLPVGAARSRFTESAKPRLRPHWEILSADRDGRATLRCWRLPRIAWPGLAVWDHCGGAGSAGGRYELTTIDNDGVCVTTGFRFRNLRSLADHLLPQ